MTIEDWGLGGHYVQYVDPPPSFASWLTSLDPVPLAVTAYETYTVWVPQGEDPAKVIEADKAKRAAEKAAKVKQKLTAYGVEQPQPKPYMFTMDSIYESWASLYTQKPAPFRSHQRLATEMFGKIPDMGKVADCPADDPDVAAYMECGNRNIFYQIVHLNDRHQWSRERIADWLDELSATHGYDFSFPMPEGATDDDD